MKTLTRWFAPLLLSLGLIAGTVALASPARADVATYQYCDSNNWCINAWGGGGTYANEYAANVVNDYWTLTGNTYDNIDQVFNNMQNVGACIGDLNNDQNNARAGVQFGCSGTVPWGANFIASFCDSNSGWTFYDVHWGGYLAPATPEHSGQALYLNSATPKCWHITKMN